MKKRFLAFLICVLMLGTVLLPVAAIAESFSPDVTTNLHLIEKDYTGETKIAVRLSENNDSVVFDASATNDDPTTYPITYQWYKNGESISDETSSSLTISPVTDAAEGWYTCIIKDAYEEIEYNGRIVVQVGLCYGDMSAEEFNYFGGIYCGLNVGEALYWDATCTNDGDSEITYQWYRQNSEGEYVALENETNAVFSIDSVQLSDSGNYKVIAKDDNQELEIYAELYVIYDSGLKFTLPEEGFANINLTKDDLGKPLTLKVQATNDDPVNNPITYQWSNDEGDIVGATSTEFTIENMTAEQAGYYSCTASDGYSSTSVGFSVNTLYFLNEQETLTALPEETVNIDMTAGTALDKELTYKWSFYCFASEESVDLDHTEPILPVTIHSVENYGSYMCEVTDGTDTINYGVVVCPPVDPNVVLTDIVAVPGEKITIKGEAKTYMVNQINDYIEIWVYQYDENGDSVDFNEIGDGTLLGFMEAEVNRFKKDGYYVCEFTITIPEIDESHEGTYGLKPDSMYLSGKIQKFSLSVKDYGQITLLNEDGTSIEGVLHPGASLNLRPLENDIRNYFQRHMGENVEMIWENDVTLQIYGEAEKHIGDLTLRIPVPQGKYEGMKLTVLHYVNGEVEELEGIVENGILTINTKSLSPFAVIVPVDDDSSTDDDTPPAGDDTPPAGDDTPPAGDDAPPAGDDTPPAGDDAPPAGDDAPPAGDDAPPAGDDAPPAGDDAPPAGDDAPPAGDDAPPADDDAPPADDDAPPADDDAPSADDEDLPDVPKAGDSSQMLFFIFLGCSAAAAAGLILKKTLQRK